VNKRPIVFLSILSLFLSPALNPVNAAAKAGSKCTKVGVKSVVNDKSYVCTKSGKKLTWLESKNKKSSPGLPGGFETNTTYSTDIGYDHEFVHPTAIDPGTPTEWKAMESQFSGQKLGLELRDTNLVNSVQNLQ
jgi:hypothetical protein